MTTKGPLTVEIVRALVAKIAGARFPSGNFDDESAHADEDELYQAVLSAIATGACDDPAGCAAEALKTKDLDFARWYA